MNPSNVDSTAQLVPDDASSNPARDNEFFVVLLQCQINMNLFFLYLHKQMYWYRVVTVTVLVAIWSRAFRMLILMSRHLQILRTLKQEQVGKSYQILYFFLIFILLLSSFYPEIYLDLVRVNMTELQQVLQVVWISKVG